MNFIQCIEVLKRNAAIFNLMQCVKVLGGVNMVEPYERTLRNNGNFASESLVKKSD
jgi:hypothetical protein